ncbi:hypothetical protein MKX96_12870 [Psychrobacillus sp. FSL W7-1493]|uniref:hypothetical protein n=1 Tax=Psychrobacillus sp. FSL W7-1493 TaxID=2921552 RepID=UPI0030FADC6D
MKQINKFLIMIIVIYIIALLVNFVPAIKFPDHRISIFNLAISILFLIGILYYSSVKNGIVLYGIAFVATSVIFVVNLIESYLFDYVVLDVLANIQYPLYVIFVIPFFGLNKLLNMSYGNFSFIVSLLYLIILAGSLLKYKWKVRNTSLLILVLLFYCLPFGYYGMYLDYMKGSLLGYLLMIIVTSALAYICKAFLLVRILIIGNILSAICSLYFIHMMDIKEDWGYFFKPFRQTTLFFIIFLLNCIPQWFVIRLTGRRDRKR